MLTPFLAASKFFQPYTAFFMFISSLSLFFLPNLRAATMPASKELSVFFLEQGSRGLWLLL